MIRPTCLFLFLLLLLTNISFADEPKLDWVQVTEKAGWQPRDSQGELVYKDQLWSPKKRRGFTAICQ